MKISELLAEGTFSHQLRETPRTIRVSSSWHKTWQKSALGFDGVEQELEQFYLDKCWFNPPLPYGKKDYPFSGNLKDLKGMDHAHMHFGKVVVIYNVDQQHVNMYVAGDHKIVESGGLATLGKQVQNLKKGTWSEEPAPARKVTPVDNVPEGIKQAILELYEVMQSDATAYKVLRQFAQDDQQYWQLIPYQQMNPDLNKVTPKTMHDLAVAFLQQS